MSAVTSSPSHSSGSRSATNSLSITSFDFARGASRSKTSRGSSEILYVPRSIVVNHTPWPGTCSTTTFASVRTSIG